MTPIRRKKRATPRAAFPSFAESHVCKPADEGEVSTLRSLGARPSQPKRLLRRSRQGGYASEGSARRSMWRGATAIGSWGTMFERMSGGCDSRPLVIEISAAVLRIHHNRRLVRWSDGVLECWVKKLKKSEPRSFTVVSYWRQTRFIFFPSLQYSRYN